MFRVDDESVCENVMSLFYKAVNDVSNGARQGKDRSFRM